MRLPFLLPLLGLVVALAGLVSSAGSQAPRASIDGILPVFDIAESYIRSQTDGSAVAIGYNGVANCSSKNPCILGSCCNSDGQCGYRSEHCSPSSPKTCVANCDAKAPCGEFSLDGKTSCPLNVCCSSFGFCGTSDIFCRDAAVASTTAGAAGVPSCGKNSGTASRRVAYYQSWNYRTRGCDNVMPNQLNLAGITHLVLAFATIDPTTFKVGLLDPADEKVYRQFLDLPDSVSKWIALGGFQFTDPDQPTHETFSKMTSSKENRKVFIDSLQQFLAIYKFSGVDIDWEWPGNTDRGGNPSDKANQVHLLKDMRQALGSNFGLGVAIPAQYEYLRNIDLNGLEAQVDWLSILTYDLHGAWDTTIPGLAPKIKPHTDLQEVDQALNLLWTIQIDSKKINMGIANYGRGYTVESKDCMWYGCTFTGPSKAGSCTLQDGILSSCEIRRLISEKHLSWKVIDGGAEVNEVSWADQWIAWDNDNTLNKKFELANDRCLGGTALWAIDYDVCRKGGGLPETGVPGSSAAPSQPASSRPASSQPALTRSSWSAPPESPPSSAPSAAPSGSQGSSAAPSTDARSSASLLPPASSAQGSSQIGTSSPATSAPGWSPSPGGSSSRWSEAPFSTAWGSSAPNASTVASSAAFNSQASSKAWTAPAPPGASSSSNAWTAPTSSDSGSSSNTWAPPASSGVGSSSDAWIPPVSSGASLSSNVWTGPASSNLGSSSNTWVAPPLSGATSSSVVASSDGPQSSGVNQPSLSTGSSAASSAASSDAGSSTAGSSAAQSSGTESSAGANSGSGGTTTAPPPALPATTGVVTTTSALPSHRDLCPRKCWDYDWCKVFCNDNDFVWPPPVNCWYYDWCRLWWGFTDNKLEEKDGKKCKILGCGCGWMGLPWGPGCPSDKIEVPFPINIFIDIFGLFPNPCLFWGCGDKCGIFGCFGYCFGEGCTECPKIFCKGKGPMAGPLPKDKIPPKPPLPTDPGKGPKKCELDNYKTATERVVFCIESVDLSSAVSATTIPTWASATASTSTTSYSTCQTLVDNTISGCYVVDFYSTTTTKVTSKNSISSETPGPACTRAPLSLDDDEGNNIPVDWSSSSSMFGSNTTDFASQTSISSSVLATSSNPSVTTPPQSTHPRTSLLVGTSAFSKAPSPPPPAPGHMDKNGVWRCAIQLWMEKDRAKMSWQLYDPNGNRAGQNYMEPVEGTKGIYAYIESLNRVEEHMMPFGVDAWFDHPTAVEDATVSLQIKNYVPGCDKMKGVQCFPKMITENKSETKMFMVDSCYQYCDKSKPELQLLKPADLNCDDMNDADWTHKGNIWQRNFDCYWKGF